MFLLQFLTRKRKLVVALEATFENGGQWKQAYDLTQMFEGYLKGEVNGDERIHEQVQTQQEGLIA
jgi:hypothetical protein